MPLKRIRLDRNGRIVQVSERALALLELEPEAAVGRYCWDVVRGTDDFGRPVCARCPVLARLRGGAYEAEVRLRVRGQRLRCQAVVQDSGVQVVLDERRRPKLGEVLFSLSWVTQRMVDEPMRFFQTAELFLGKLRGAAGMDAAELFLADPEHKYLILTALEAENRSAFLERPWFALGEGYPGIVAVDRSPLVTHRLDEDERYLRLKVKEAGYRTYLVFPLELPQGVIGVLNLASKDPNADEGAALELLEAVAPVLAAGVYSVLTSMGERQLLALLRQSKLSDRDNDAVIESLLRSAMAFSGAKAAQYKDRSGRRVAVPAQLTVNCDREDCPVWIGEPYAVRAGGRPCPWVEEGRPRYCLPVVVQGEVMAVESIFFSRVPRPQTRAMAPLLWLQRMAWQLLGSSAAAAEDAAAAPPVSRSGRWGRCRCGSRARRCRRSGSKRYPGVCSSCSWPIPNGCRRPRRSPKRSGPTSTPPTPPAGWRAWCTRYGSRSSRTRARRGRCARWRGATSSGSPRATPTTWSVSRR